MRENPSTLEAVLVKAKTIFEKTGINCFADDSRIISRRITWANCLLGTIR